MIVQLSNKQMLESRLPKAMLPIQLLILVQMTALIVLDRYF